MRVFGYGAQTAGGTMEPVQFEREPLRPGEVAITITHCGVCHTDWHMVRNDFKSSLFPIVPGHEITGVVTEVGAGVKKFAVGDRVGIGCMINSCRQCKPCQRGDEQYCEGAISCTFTYNGTKVPTGKNTYGGYSTQIIVREEFVVRIPAGLSNAEAAPLLCAGVTTYQQTIWTQRGTDTGSCRVRRTRPHSDTDWESDGRESDCLHYQCGQSGRRNQTRCRPGCLDGRRTNPSAP